MKIFLATIFLGFGLLTNAQQFQIDSLKQCIPNQTGSDLVQSLNELSWYYKNISPDSAIIMAKQAVGIAEKINSELHLVMSFNSLGSAYQAIGDYDEAITQLTKALSYREGQKDSLNIAKTLNNLGICADEKAQFDDALAYYFRGLSIAEEMADLNTAAMLIGNIGIVYKKQKDYLKVLEYYQKALDIYDTLDNKFGLAVTKGNIGSVHIQLKNYEKAISYSELAEKLYEKLGYSRYVPYVIGNAAIAYDSLGQDKAEQLYLKAIAGHQAHNNQYELAYTYKNLGGFYLENNKPQEAFSYLQLAVSTARNIGAKEMLQDALSLIAENMALLGDYRAAFNFYVEYASIRDSIYQENKTRQIYELQAQYETEKKEQQIALQQAELTNQQAELNLDRVFIVSLFIIILSLLAIGVLVRKRMILKRQKLLEEEKAHTREAQIKSAITSQESERSRFARDLHDGFGQMISILNLNLKSLRDDKPDKQEVFDKSADILEDMYQELKGVCFNLMPQTLIKHGVKSALQEFAGRVNISNQMFVETSFFGLEERLSDLQEISIYRISQEWVNNVIKYSDAERILIQVTMDEEEITLMVEDNGTGFDKSKLTDGSGNGWKNMNSRSSLIGGELELDSTDGVRGSTLILNAPAQGVGSEKLIKV